ncbi:MAG: AAA domain-containing protein [Chitinivibrionales bacterium]|nr:AAA domain-containing protein [Chitinivibrionales bacterium]
MTTNTNDVALIESCSEAHTKIKAELSKKIVGQNDVIDDLLACFLAGGHCLLIGVPGLAKTMLVQSLAESLDCVFNRVQFTPDLMPSDITGSEILYEDRTTGHREFRFVNGPVFTNILLADEINRTPPKTQSALLQAMQEHEITSGGKTFPLPSPFWVLATQNPIEQEGTYPLPEAQQDRFMFSIEVNYPEYASEVEIVKATTRIQEISLTPQMKADDIKRFQELVRRVPAADSVIEFAVSLVRRSRPDDEACSDKIRNLLTWGAGPRASQYLILAAKAYAALEGRPTPDISDIKRAAPPVLRHRLIRSFHAETENISANEIVSMLLD